MPDGPPVAFVHRHLSHFHVPINANAEMGLDYAGKQGDKQRCYQDLDHTDTKGEPYTPTEDNNSYYDAVSEAGLMPPVYSATHSTLPTSMRIDDSGFIYMEKEEYDRVGECMCQVFQRLQREEEIVMEGVNIITSLTDEIAEHLRDPMEIECHTAIIYHVIANALLPGGTLVVAQGVPDPGRPEDRQITLRTDP